MIKSMVVIVRKKSLQDLNLYWTVMRVKIVKVLGVKMQEKQIIEKKL